MKLVHKQLEKDGSGSLTLVPEMTEDLWTVYNIIGHGDRVRAKTFRKIVNQSATGSTNANVKRFLLTVTVEDIDFDPRASTIRIKGKNVTENEHVRMGAYHTIELGLNRKFTVDKDVWDAIFFSYVEKACDPASSADLAAVIMQEGIASVNLITESLTLVQSRIESSLPRKRGAAAQGYDKALRSFFAKIMDAVNRHIDFDVVKCVLVASPGFLNSQFLKYMFEEAVRANNKTLIQNKAKFVPVHSSTGFVHSLKEVLSDPNVMKQLQDTKAAEEVQLLDEFYTMLGSDPERAYYGPGHVLRANEELAIDKLLIVDTLFRSMDIAERQKFVSLVESVKDNGGFVRVFSSQHVSGQQLDKLSGVAAILRFPLPEPESDGAASSSDSEDDMIS